MSNVANSCEHRRLSLPGLARLDMRERKIGPLRGTSGGRMCPYNTDREWKQSNARNFSCDPSFQRSCDYH